MQKLCPKNGSHLQSLFCLHLKSLVAQYSTKSSSKRTPPPFIADYMVNSIGFSMEEAVTALKKVSSSSRMRQLEKPKLVVNFMKERGLDNTQIRKIVSLMPYILWYNVGKTLEPKFKALEKLGISGSALPDVVASNTSLIRASISRVTHVLRFVKPVLDDDENYIKFLKRAYWLMNSDVAAVLKPNILLLQSFGLSDRKIQKLLVSHAQIFGHGPKKIAGVLVKVEEELGIHRSWSVFTDAFIVMASLSEDTIEHKRSIFRSFGFTDSDIDTLVKKRPKCLSLSETLIRERLGFFINELGCELEYLMSRPHLLNYSMEVRVLPRLAILKGLRERELINATSGALALVSTSEPVFLKKYVLPYKNELPELCKAYIYRKKGCLPGKLLV